ncbi:HNH endonuclease [Ruegeria arenilitoris]|uniref:HNH endonuclease n=1 Tax=Ruegeria arenilitoris TaxID=1173585 RepID=UPI00147D3352|nr:HNH endonuclease [Ruegeria arenilitoris]
MKWRDSVELALQNLGGSTSLDRLYEEVRAIRVSNNDTTPKSLEAVVRKELEYNSSDSSNWQGDRDLFYSVHGIGMGVWGLRALISETPLAHDIELPETTGEAVRLEVTTNRIIRDTDMTKKVKALHNNECQMCGGFIELPNGQKYVEAHHIIPLGAPHNGPDTPDNIVVVCPNHHAMLDFGCITLSKSLLKNAVGHCISDASISYHNQAIFLSS